jgi:hypothetical protein
MKRILAVIGMLLLVSVGAFAAKPSYYNFWFDGFCDGMNLTLYSPGAPIPKVFVTGVHDLYTYCGDFYVGVGGFKHGINKLYIPPYVSPILDVSDPVEGLFGYPWSLQYLVRPMTAPCVWANYYSDGSGLYLLYYDTCTKYAPGAKPNVAPGTKSSIKR